MADQVNAASADYDDAAVNPPLGSSHIQGAIDALKRHFFGTSEITLLDTAAVTPGFSQQDITVLPPSGYTLDSTFAVWPTFIDDNNQKIWMMSAKSTGSNTIRVTVYSEEGTFPPGSSVAICFFWAKVA